MNQCDCAQPNQKSPPKGHPDIYHRPISAAKGAGSHHAGKSDMRGLVTFILVAAIGGGLFLWQKQHQQKPVPPDPQAPSQQHSATSRPALTPAPRGQASEYNWMKRSL